MLKNKIWVQISGILSAFIGLTFFFNKMSWTSITISDNASVILQVKDFLSGNWLLHGWTLPPDPFTTTDIQFYIVGILIRGFSPNLMHNIPAVVYAILVLVSAFLAGEGFGSRRKWAVRIIVAVGMSLVGPWNISTLLVGPLHVATMLMVTVSIFLLQFRNKAAEILAYVTMVVAMIGDPLSLLMGPIPIVLAIVYHKIRKITIYHSMNYKLALKIIITIFVGLSIRYLIPKIGGYDLAPFTPTSMTWVEITRNIHLLIQGIPTLYGANFVGHSIDLVGIGYFVRIIPLLYLGYVIWKWLTKKQSFAFLDSVLIFAIPLVAIFFVIYAIDINQIRYLDVLLVYGIVLMGRHIAKTGWTKRSILIKGAVAALIIATWVPSIELNPTADISYVALGNWLLTHHLYSGYAGYWNSNIVTVLSNEKVSIAPIVGWGENGTLSPFHLMSTTAWYENPQHPPRTFLVYDDSNWGSVNRDTAVKTWGEPSSIEKVNNFTILIWDHPIIPNPALMK